MSLKDLFNVKQVLPPISNEQIAEDVESVELLDSYNKQKNRIEFAVDYSTASNFAIYGSAKKYYEDSFARIYEQYPYDGSKKEVLDWENSSSLLDVWIYNNVYPKTTGYAVFSPNGWSTRVGSIVSGYGEPTTKEYISLKGGPNTNSTATLVEKFKDASNQAQKANVYDVSAQRNNNLDLNLSGGVSVEFWLKKVAFNNSNTSKEVIFDLWNNQVSSSTNYGRLTVELSGTTGSPFYVTLMSGTSGFSSLNVGTNITTASVASNTWNHYAITAENSGSAINVKFYINGELNYTTSSGNSINPITGSMLANIGALRTAASGTATAIGWGKLSGSIDEFRYWKTTRTSKDIGRYWWTNVYGGSNSDDANTDLGVYYKFNEGITTTASVDSIVLDYSGRVTNGTWTGYTAASRNTGSAINLYGSLSSEKPDPIIYSNHSDVVEQLATYSTIGEDYDRNNPSSIFYSFPNWIVEEDTGILLNISQIAASYLDNLYLQIKNFTNIKEHYSNIQIDEKPFPFSRNLIESLGLITPNIFIDASLFEEVMSRDEDRSYEDKLNEVRNIIYENIYSNLQSIYKTKGTEKSFRNLLRCFGIDEKLVKLNIYSNNDFKIVKDDLSNITTKKKSINFNDPDRFFSTIYQFSTSSYADSNSYISGSSVYDYVPFTFEVDTIFPKKLKQNQNEFFPTLFLTSSVFGAHTAKSTSTDLTWETNDYFNFQVFAIRPEYESDHATFYLSSSNSAIPTLSSSLLFDVYNNEKWNFVVKLYPQFLDNANLVSGSVSGSYTLDFYGVSTIGDSILREFSSSATIPYADGINLTRANKRFYLGAERTNFTGSIIKQTDIKVLDFKVWSSKLDNDDIKVHARDSDNYGIEDSAKSSYLSQTSLNNSWIPKFETLLLHWDFNQVTSSDSGSGILNASDGKFIVDDLTSGSLSYNRYNSAFNTLKKYDYIGRGDFFLQNDATITDTQYLFTSRLNEFENIQNSNLIYILTEDEQNQIRTRETRPVNYFFSFEKSMYQTISEEMLKMFSTILDFNNLVGNPINKYRKDYKDLRYLRTLFFQNVQNEPDLDKYLDFYKWIDSALGKMLLQLVPASADTSHGLLNVVENHTLTRNKHQYKFPTIELKQPILETGAISINRHLYNWKFGHRPLGNTEDENCFYWNARAERDVLPLSSSVSGTNNTRNQILSTTLQVLNRSFTTPYRYKNDFSTEIKGGTNFYKNTNIEFLKIATAPHGPMDTDAIINIPANYLFIGVDNTSSVLKDCTDTYNPAAKVKYHFNVVHGRDYLSSSLGYGEVLKSNLAIPANFISGTVENGYNSEVVQNFMSGVIITNIHNDAYGDSKEIPAQGPFTNQWVGGLQSRHVALNRGTDTYTNRPEAWKLLIGQLGTSSYEATLGFVGADYPHPEGNPDEPSYPVRTHQKAYYYRDFTAKSVYNIKNIQTTTSSYNLGNFDRRYQAVHTFGRTNNDLVIKEATSSLTQTELFGILRTDVVDGRVNYTLSTRTRNEVVVGNRFSSPGEYRTNSRGYLNLYAEELSPYNVQPFKNRKIIGDNRRVNLNLTNDSILYTPEIVSGALGKDLNALTAIPMMNGYQSGSTTVASFHKVPRNGGWEIEYSGTSIVTKQQFDNAFYNYDIPRTDAQYKWIKTSLTSSDKTLLEYQGHLPETMPSGSTSYEPTLSVITASLVGYAGPAHTYGAESGVEFKPVDFVGMNDVIFDKIDTTTFNQLGTFNLVAYKSDITTFNASSLPRLLNGILLNRNGPFGYPTFKQIRTSNKIIKNQINNTFYTILDNQDEIIRVREPYVYYNYPIVIVLQNNITNEKFEVTTTYDNIKNNFENPSILNNIKSLKTGETFYENIFSFLSNNQNYSLISLSYKTQIYPKAEFKTINAYKLRNNVEFNWKDSQDNRVTASIDPVTEISVNTSVWDLDSQNDFTVPYLSSSIGSAGVLQNAYSTVHNGVTSSISASILYAFKHMLASKDSWTSPSVFNSLTSSNAFLNITNGLFNGTTKWLTGEQSGKNPYYNTYNDWNNEIKYKNKNFQIIPEYYVSSDNIVSLLNNLNFTNTNVNRLFVYGQEFANIGGGEGFKNIYLESDSIKNIDNFKKDVSSVKKSANITLTCDALIKFNPKNGLYPAQRTTELAKLFYDSIFNHITFWTSSADVNNFYNDYNVAMRNFLTPTFAPGLMYNTIKSGIAVDFPVLTSSLSTTSSYYSPAAVTSGAIDYMINNSLFDKRLPFEALYDTEAYLKGIELIDMHPHPSASLDVTGSWDGEFSSNNYKLAIHNFLSEVVDFFLPEGKLSTITSKPENQFKKVDPSKEYRAIIKLYKSKGYPDLLSKREILNRVSSTDPTTNYTRPQFSPKERESINMYSRASAFGPPVAGGLSGSVYTDSIIDSSNGYYSPFTPPYYDGEAWVLLTYKPTGSVSYVPTLDEIINNITASYLRYEFNSGTLSNNTAPLAYGYLNKNSMQISASVNLFNIINIEQINADNNSNNSTTTQTSKAWSISTKFETPILNFTDDSDSGYQVNDVYGMWHQYGELPTERDKGIFLQISDVPDDYILYGGESDERRTLPTGRDLKLTGSLADIVGFSKAPTKLGQVSNQKIIKEAVVAIPFAVVDNERKYFEFNELSKRYVSFLKSEQSEIDSFPQESEITDSVKNQISLMSEYVLPPIFDFMKNDLVQPISMYMFEFDYTLTQQDLVDIWQGIMPDISINFAEQSKSITHELASNELISYNDLNEKLQWLVFKVKKKARNNYNAKLLESMKSNRTTNKVKRTQQIGKSQINYFDDSQELDYSYNWPYDFFNLVEVAKIDAKVDFLSYEQIEELNLDNLIDVPTVNANQLSDGTKEVVTEMQKGIIEAQPSLNTAQGYKELKSNLLVQQTLPEITYKTTTPDYVKVGEGSLIVPQAQETKTSQDLVAPLEQQDTISSAQNFGSSFIKW